MNTIPYIAWKLDVCHGMYTSRHSTFSGSSEQGTSHYCLCFCNNNIVLEGFTYANMDGDADTRNPTTGYLYTFSTCTVLGI